MAETAANGATVSILSSNVKQNPGRKFPRHGGLLHEQPARSNARTLTERSDGLHALVLSRLGEDPRGGAVFCFINRSPTANPASCACPALAHARRKFHEAFQLGQALAAGPLAAIQGLYRIENGIWPTAVGKKAWLFMGGEPTGQRVNPVQSGHLWLCSEEIDDF